MLTKCYFDVNLNSKWSKSQNKKEPWTQGFFFIWFLEYLLCKLDLYMIYNQKRKIWIKLLLK